ncbi:Uu.00g078250.m01.CDS01 [Anthostomella pinea]|uniref:Uu.00g078250.m01.CDS01 n=1 Tax=Anthostomella pinea TaxID=933095 RepID=A0AAI8VKI4_9PEZI|nr:Uu.00g078250.m01.CDS01 [Anthostomella pinea]
MRHLGSLVSVFLLFFGTSAGATIPSNKSSNTRDPLLDHNDCQFYGYMEGDSEMWNVYGVEIAGWGNNGIPGTCAAAVPINLQQQCLTEVFDWECHDVRENLHDTAFSFRILKSARSQPACVNEAIRLASQTALQEQIHVTYRPKGGRNELLETGDHDKEITAMCTQSQLPEPQDIVSSASKLPRIINQIKLQAPSISEVYAQPHCQTISRELPFPVLQESDFSSHTALIWKISQQRARKTRADSNEA